MRHRRSLRRAVLSIAALAAVLLLPAAAHAAPDWSTSTLTSTGPYVPGGTVTYTLTLVNTGTATTASGSVVLNQDYSAVTITGTPAVSGGQAAKVTTTAGSNSITVLTTFAGAGASATVTFSVVLPDSYDAAYQVVATGTVDGATVNAEDASRVLESGGPSAIVVDDVSPYPWIATKDAPHARTLRVTNRGTGPAQSLQLVQSGVYGSNDSLLSPTPPAFTPTGTFSAGCTSVTNGGTVCRLGTLAAGASVDVTFTFAGLTHYGSFSAYFNTRTADGGPKGSGYLNARISDGTRADVDMSINGPLSAAGRTAITYTGYLRNGGTTAVGSSVLLIHASGFNAQGNEPSSTATELDSVTSITLSNGATCAKRVISSVPQPNEFTCPITGIPAGTAITATIVVNYPTSVPDTYSSVSMDLHSTTDLEDTYASRSTRLNVQRTATLQHSLTGPAVIGAGRVAPVVLTIRNTGNTQLRYVGGTITLPSSDATVLQEELPSGCRLAGTQVYCTRRALDVDATASWTLLVHAPAAVGGKVRVVSTGGEWNSSLDDAFYGDWSRAGSALVMDVVKPSLVPLLGAKVAKPVARTGDQLANAGLPSTVTCPGACRVAVQLRVSRSLAARYGLIRPTKRAGWLVLGTGTGAKGSAGTVPVTTRLAMKYRTAFRVLGRPLPLQRVTTVTSTATNTRDARWTATTPFTVRPAKRS